MLIHSKLVIFKNWIHKPKMKFVTLLLIQIQRDQSVSYKCVKWILINNLPNSTLLRGLKKKKMFWKYYLYKYFLATIQSRYVLFNKNKYLKIIILQFFDHKYSDNKYFKHNEFQYKIKV